MTPSYSNSFQYCFFHVDVISWSVCTFNVYTSITFVTLTSLSVCSSLLLRQWWNNDSKPTDGWREDGQLWRNQGSFVFAVLEGCWGEGRKVLHGNGFDLGSAGGTTALHTLVLEPGVDPLGGVSPFFFLKYFSLKVELQPFFFFNRF